MDAKTYEYMNERVDKYKDIQRKIEYLKSRIQKIEDQGFRDICIRDHNGYYNEIKYVDKDLMKETLIKLMTDKIAVLEKELEQI